MSARIDHNLPQLNEDIRRYAFITGKTAEESLDKHGSELGWALARRLRQLAPDRGQIRAELMERLKRGQGVKVDPRLREKIYAKRKARTDIGSRRLVFGAGAGAGSLNRKGRRLNLQALAVQAELNLRERARGFLGISSVRPPRGISLRTRRRSWSRFGPILAEAGLRPDPHSPVVQFRWGEFGGLSEGAAEGLQRPEAKEMIAAALADTSANLRTYLERKLEEKIRTAFR